MGKRCEVCGKPYVEHGGMNAVCPPALTVLSPEMRLYHAADAVLLQFVDDPNEYSDRERADVLGRLHEAMAGFATTKENG